jgi:hypothetical protein
VLRPNQASTHLQNRSRLEGRFPEVAVDAHGTALGAGALGFASGEVVAKARCGAAGQNSHAHTTCRNKSHGTKAGS